MNNYYAQKSGNRTIFEWLPRKKSKGWIAMTSILSNQQTDKENQMSAMMNAYEENPEGLTDAETSAILKIKGFNIPNSTISARRNDINDKYVQHCDNSHTSAAYLLVNVGRRNNPYPPFRSAMVWKINERL